MTVAIYCLHLSITEKCDIALLYYMHIYVGTCSYYRTSLVYQVKNCSSCETIANKGYTVSTKNGDIYIFVCKLAKLYLFLYNKR